MKNKPTEQSKTKRLSIFNRLFNLPEDRLLKWLPFVLFLSFLGLIYIYNSHLAEKRIRQINTMETEIEKKRWEYVTIKSELMNKSKLSEMELLVSDDLEKSPHPPIKINRNKK